MTSGCKKGNRECVYPEKTNPSKTGGSKNSQPFKQENHDSSTDEYEDDDDGDRLKTILDEDESLNDSQKTGTAKFENRQESTSQSLKHEKSFSRGDSETPSLVQDKGPSPSPSTEGSIGYPGYSGCTTNSRRGQAPNFLSESEGLRNDWSHLPQDLQFYLTYFCDNLTYNHYALKHDSGDFLRTYFLDAALRNDALLFAVVGFSAFQYTLTNPRGLIQDFLQYYNKAVSLLLRLLKKGERHNLGILLTMLQLATIEVSCAKSSCTRSSLTNIGISGRLDKSFGPSKSCVRDFNGALYPSKNNGDRAHTYDPWMVRSIRCFCWAHGRV